MSGQFHVPTNWYEDFFTAPINSFWEKMVPAEATAADIGFLRRHLGTRPPARVLDIPCGAGRHAFALAEAGYNVTGVDLSGDAIARASATAHGAGLSADFLRCDMRNFIADVPLDAAICMGNSIAYFGAEGLLAYFRALARNVRQGGRLVLDSHSCAESVFPLQQERQVTFEGGTYTSVSCYDAFTSTLSTEAELRLAGVTHMLRYAHHIVTSGELILALGGAGFAAEGLYGDTDDAPYGPGSPRLLLVAARR